MNLELILMHASENVSEGIKKPESPTHFEIAVSLCTKAIESEPSVQAYSTRGEAYVFLGRFDEAIDDLTNAVKIGHRPKDYQFRGLAYQLKGRFQEALEDFSKASELSPETPEFLLYKSWALKDLGMYEDAIEALNKAFELDPKDHRYIEFKADYLFKVGRVDEALVDINVACRFNKNLFNYHRRSRIHLRNCDYEKAKADLKMILRLYGNNKVDRSWDDHAAVIQAERTLKKLGVYVDTNFEEQIISKGLLPEDRKNVVIEYRKGLFYLPKEVSSKE